ncbi:MAG: AAA family ATPase [Candidatus Thorarchaeota archaeon]
MIGKIGMTNFRIYHEQFIDLGPGTTVVVGPNGAGKTTILEAIEFALYRTVTRKEKRVGHLSDLIRYGQDRAQVELEFTSPMNARQYRVLRTIIDDSTTTAKLTQTDRSDVLSSTVKDVDETIVRLLGMDKDAFAALTYVRQGEILRLSRLTPKERREYMLDMMGLGLYAELTRKVAQKRRAIESNINDIETRSSYFRELLKLMPSKDDVSASLEAIGRIEETLGSCADVLTIKTILQKLSENIRTIEEKMETLLSDQSRRALMEKRELTGTLQTILGAIPEVAETQLRPAIQQEARNIFLGIFGDRYSDLLIEDNYEVVLHNLQGARVPLADTSGGEDVCINFALRVAVNAALQKQVSGGRNPGILILDEPGAGLDSQRRRWLPEAISSVENIGQVIVVTHMDELKEAADTVITLTPQGKGRGPRVEVS